MPKKRRTKVVASSSKTQSADEESGNSSTSEERQKNLDLYLEDFDMRVAKYISQARDEAKTMCNAIKAAFLVEFMKMPKHIQGMTKTEFMAKGGSIDESVLQQISKVTDALAFPITAKGLSVSKPSEAAGEVGEENTATKKAATTTKKKGTKGKKRTTTATTKRTATKRSASVLADSQEENLQGNNEPQTIRRSTRRKTTRNQFVTPATKTGKTAGMYTGWDTPLVTPKFDPRLPVTPATCVMRNAKRGETIISLSGSPINIPTQRNVSKPEAVIPLGDGTSLTIGTSSPQVDMAMNEATRKNILLLQSNLAKILQRHPTVGES